MIGENYAVLHPHTTLMSCSKRPIKKDIAADGIELVRFIPSLRDYLRDVLQAVSYLINRANIYKLKKPNDLKFRRLGKLNEIFITLFHDFIFKLKPS